MGIEHLMKIYIETYGCAANHADSDQMKTLLAIAGYKIVDSEKNADIIILNSCGVKGPTENKIIFRLEELKKKKKNVIIAGCLTKIRTKLLKERFPDFSLMGPDQISEITEIVKEVLDGKRVIKLEEKNYCPIPFKNVKKAQPVVIQKGCLYSCTYCATKLARGKLYSFPIDCIRKIVEDAVRKGAKRILLTGQDTGAYGLDIKTNLIELLKNLVKIEGNFKIRIGMMNPNHALRMLDDLIDIYKNEKIEKFIHIPVQSGSDKVLKDMKRPYTIKDFKFVVKKLREKIPNLIIWTDIIVGYPTESEEDFKKTIELIKELKFDFINISKFYLRPGTEAEKLKQLPTKVIKERSRKLSKIYWKLRKA